MLQIAWLSRHKKSAVAYPIRGNRGKQLLATSFVLAWSLLLPYSAHAITEPQKTSSTTLPSENYGINTVATGLNSPWSMVQLPNGTWLITERDGHIVIVKEESQLRTKLALDGLFVAGQGGLLDIVLAPDYSESKTLFFTYAQGQLSANRLVVAKATFDGNSFSKPQVIYQVATDKGTPQHYAGRLLMLPDNTLMFSSGDGFDYREQAQIKTSQLGKLLRINLDGTMPNNNPFIEHQNQAAHAVFSIGHRNTQGLVYDYDSGQIVSHEHGPAGGDELNYISAGNNYGWPVITYGKDYSQARISPFTEYPGMQLPSVNWTPSIAPSGMAYYGKNQQSFASLQGQVLVTTLVDRKLYAVDLNDENFVQANVFPEVTGRLRDVVVTANGNVAVLTDGKAAELLVITAN